MVKLLGSIPETAWEMLETYVEEDLLGAVVTDAVTVVDGDGKIFLSEIILRLKDGRKVAIEPEMRGMCPWLVLEIHDGEEWRKMSVTDDYIDEFEKIMTEGFTP